MTSNLFTEYLGTNTYVADTLCLLYTCSCVGFVVKLLKLIFFYFQQNLPFGGYGQPPATSGYPSQPPAAPGYPIQPPAGGYNTAGGYPGGPPQPGQPPQPGGVPGYPGQAPPTSAPGGYGLPAGGYGQPAGGYGQPSGGYGQPTAAGGMGYKTQAPGQYQGGSGSYKQRVRICLILPPGIYAKGYIVFVFPFIRSYVGSFPRVGLGFIEFASKFLKWCISQQLLIRKHSYLDHSYLGGLAFTMTLDPRVQI